MTAPKPPPEGTSIVPLENLPPRTPEPSPMGRGHAAAITGMAICALVGIASMLVFTSVGWPGGLGRYVVMVLVASAIGFLVCAAFAVLTAARDTYPRRKVGEP